MNTLQLGDYLQERGLPDAPREVGWYIVRWTASCKVEVVEVTHLPPFWSCRGPSGHFSSGRKLSGIDCHAPLPNLLALERHDEHFRREAKDYINRLIETSHDLSIKLELQQMEIERLRASLKSAAPEYTDKLTSAELKSALTEYPEGGTSTGTERLVASKVFEEPK